MTATPENPHRTGLSDEEVRKSRTEHGTNLLTPPQRPSLWKLYLEKFEDPVIRVLLLAALLSLVISIIENEYAETIGIIAAILLATGIGFLFEYDANRKFDLLNAVNEETPVTVIRNGGVTEVPRREIVVGDTVVLETGDEVPADGRLLEAVAMQVNESNLTGEPVVHKSADPALADPEATYPTGEVLRGTTVVDGHGLMLVERVGDATEIGRVARQSSEQNTEPTPLNLQLNRLARLIGRIGFTVAGVAFAVFFVKDVLLHYDFSSFHTFGDWLPALKSTLQYFMMAVTLIVVAVPEGLPMSVTLSLALNMRRMLATHNLVRKMHACETMGAINVICTDKTGTLTQNLMQVHEACLFPLKGSLKVALEAEEGTEERIAAGLIAEGIGTNTTAYLEETQPGERPRGVGNPTEVALLLWLHGQGEDYLQRREAAPVIRQVTFSTERKYMSTTVRSALLPGRQICYVKGAPEIVLGMCRDVLTADGRRRSVADCRADIENRLQGYQQMAMRTLGLAYREEEEDEKKDEKKKAGQPDNGASEKGLTFLGIVAISDPIRPDVPAAVERCRKAGIDVKIVTGDTPGTATEIARQIGLWQDGDTERNRITGTEFAALTDEEALERVEGLKVMSRARPGDKQRLVQLLQRRGAVVAVTGDGTNDAPALNHAQVGLSMGSGTSVAKEASDITLLDDSFSSIGTAVMWGRSLYKNIQRFIVFQLTINLVALAIVLLGSLVGTDLPLTVTQMLWVNLIMDTFAALALASIPPSEEVMGEQPRRPADFIISPALRRFILLTGTIFTLLLMGMLLWFERAEGGMDVHRLTLFFTTFVMLQFWNLFNARAFGSARSAFHGLSCSYGMELIALAIVVGQFAIVQWGGEVFRTEPLSLTEWAVITGATSLVLWTGEAVRRLTRRKRNAYNDSSSASN